MARMLDVDLNLPKRVRYSRASRLSLWLRVLALCANSSVVMMRWVGSSSGLFGCCSLDFGQSFGY